MSDDKVTLVRFTSSRLSRRNLNSWNPLRLFATWIGGSWFIDRTSSGDRLKVLDGPSQNRSALVSEKNIGIVLSPQIEHLARNADRIIDLMYQNRDLLSESFTTSLLNNFKTKLIGLRDAWMTTSDPLDRHILLLPVALVKNGTASFYNERETVKVIRDFVELASGILNAINATPLPLFGDEDVNNYYDFSAYSKARGARSAALSKVVVDSPVEIVDKRPKSLFLRVLSKSMVILALCVSVCKGILTTLALPAMATALGIPLPQKMNLLNWYVGLSLLVVDGLYDLENFNKVFKDFLKWAMARSTKAENAIFFNFARHSVFDLGRLARMSFMLLFFLGGLIIRPFSEWGLVSGAANSKIRPILEKYFPSFGIAISAMLLVFSGSALLMSAFVIVGLINRHVNPSLYCSLHRAPIQAVSRYEDGSEDISVLSVMDLKLDSSGALIFSSDRKEPPAAFPTPYSSRARTSSHATPRLVRGL